MPKKVFWATKIERVPTKVKFRTKDGETVSFKATKIERVPTKVVFYTKKRK